MPVNLLTAHPVISMSNVKLAKFALPTISAIFYGIFLYLKENPKKLHNLTLKHM